MPRTATNSFCAAVSQLLDGPSYHVGVQTAASSNELHVRNWISVLGVRPYRKQDKQYALDILRSELDGYVMATDPPVLWLVPELLEVFPDAIVIVTMRDKKSWAVSMAGIIDLIKIDTMEILFFWVKSLRWGPTLWRLFTTTHVELHNKEQIADEKVLLECWNDHMAWLEKHVPKQKLFFYDVKDGWEPLCKILGVPVPEDVPFPRLNDAKAIETAFRNWSLQGIGMWLLLVVALVALMSIPFLFAE